MHSLILVTERLYLQCTVNVEFVMETTGRVFACDLFEMLRRGADKSLQHNQKNFSWMG
jgi:hypothetical protein